MFSCSFLPSFPLIARLLLINLPLKGRGCGDLVLVLGGVQNSHQDRHQAPASSLHHPLSLRTTERLAPLAEKPTRVSSSPAPTRCPPSPLRLMCIRADQSAVAALNRALQTIHTP